MSIIIIIINRVPLSDHCIRTLLKQSAIIRVMGVPFLQGTLEDMTARGFDSNSANGRQAIIDIVEEINKT